MKKTSNKPEKSRRPARSQVGKARSLVGAPSYPQLAQVMVAATAIACSAPLGGSQDEPGVAGGITSPYEEPELAGGMPLPYEEPELDGGITSPYEEPELAGGMPLPYEDVPPGVAVGGAGGEAAVPSEPEVEEEPGPDGLSDHATHDEDCDCPGTLVVK